MARTRSLKPSFFKNEHLAECEPMARLLFAGLWTLADSQGRLECRPLRIKAELFPYDNCDIVALLGQLEARGFVIAYRVGDQNYIQIPKFTEHQRCHPSERPEGIPAADTGEIVKFHGEPGKIIANCAFNPSTFNPSTFNPLSAPTKPATRSRSKPADPLRWSAESGWEGITDADHADWSRAYPAADLPVEFAKAHEWLKTNPKKAQKSNWRRWLTTVWLSKCQDRGGTHREAARPAATPPVDPAKRRFFRSETQQNMTDAEYATWRREQRHGGASVALATAIKLKDET